MDFYLHTFAQRSGFATGLFSAFLSVSVVCHFALSTSDILEYPDTLSSEEDDYHEKAQEDDANGGYHLHFVLCLVHDLGFA